MACVSDVARTREKDGVAWRIGAEDDVAWVREGTRPGVAITSAIPPVFADYATLVLPGNTDVPRDVADERAQDRALLALLETHTTPQPWWLGYLDTGASDIVFWDAPKVKLYEGWDYVLVQAGPEQAASWRPADGWRNWKSTELPDLMYPHDRSWLASTLWDDDWACIGGCTTLIADLLANAALGSRALKVTLDQDATPPGHVAW
jgi:hypothetical protein